MAHRGPQCAQCTQCTQLFTSLAGIWGTWFTRLQSGPNLGCMGIYWPAQVGMKTALPGGSRCRCMEISWPLHGNCPAQWQCPRHKKPTSISNTPKTHLWTTTHMTNQAWAHAHCDRLNQRHNNENSSATKGGRRRPACPHWGTENTRQPTQHGQVCVTVATCSG